MSVEMDFKGKNCVFVGGFGGIGFESCKKLLTKPLAHLFIFDVIDDPQKLKTLQTLNKNCQVHFIKFDITDKLSIKAAIKSVVDEVKYIDILVNGAGILSESNYERMLAINLTGLVTTTFEALPYMDKQRSGRGGLVANIASVVGLDPLSACVTYCTSKFGVIGFTRAMADPFYYNLTGVAVLAFCPGLTETPLKNNIFAEATFDYGQPLADELNRAYCQTATNCAEHFMHVIETDKNGSIWISDGDLKEVELKCYWTPTIVS